MPVQTQMQVRRGTASSWTSTNPTLAAGELGFETDTGKFKIGTGSSTWTALSYAGGGQNTLTTYQYTATAGQTTFSGADANGNTLSYTAGAVQVYLNGALLANTTDYAASNGTSVVLTGGAGLSDSLTILSLGSFTVSTDIPKSTLTAKGSIVAASGAATPANLSVGANDTVLTADSSTATGLKWATPATGANWSLLNAGGTALTGSQTVTVSGISGKDKIMVIVQNASSASANSLISVRLNTDTASNYFLAGAELRSTTTTASLISGLSDLFNKIYIGQMSTTGADSSVRGGIVLTGGNSAGVKQYTFFGAGEPSSGVVGARAYYGCGYYNSASTISSISVNSETGNFDAGTVYVYTSA